MVQQLHSSTVRLFASHEKRDVIALVIALHTGPIKLARDARVRLATPKEADETCCPADWPCVVLDAAAANDRDYGRLLEWVDAWLRGRGVLP